MGLNKIKSAISLLIEYWEKQNIAIIPTSIREIERLMKKGIVSLPNDFKELYSHVNGMKNLYPNEIDKEGFLFYPIESIVSAAREFENSELRSKNKIYIFAEYMHKSWWYGLEMISDNNYVIGILPDKNTFKPLTHSLSEFIELYVENSSKLYDYS